VADLDNKSPPTGVGIIETALETMPGNPGVYRMLDAKGDALYVGKARNLKKRVTSYTQLVRLPERLRRMVADTAAMEILTTHTEAEALLLEANLIKRLKPRYNILLRDDKSYPWLMLTEDNPFPQIAKHRGAQLRKGSYWGPFASAWSVNQTVQALQHAPLPVVPDQTLLRPLRRPDFRAGVPDPGGAGEIFPFRKIRGHPEGSGRRHGGCRQ
jgi:excinuclease ABC subunit C